MSLYFIAFEPPTELSDQIRLISKDFAQRFGAARAFNSFPHITLIPPFNFDEQNESQVVGRFMKMELTVNFFEVHLTRYNCFNRTKSPVIFLEPESSAELRKIYNEVNLAMSVFNYAELFHPHVTVAFRDLTYEAFLEAWEEYCEKPLDLHFEVERISLYKHVQAKWCPIAHRELLPN